MKYGVSKQALLVTAGIIWIIAGANILRIGIATWRQSSGEELFKVAEATVVFLLFFIFVFRRLYYRHTERIERKQSDKNCPFGFFDARGWIVMMLMISLGIVMRKFDLLPDRFISVFYTGLSLALIFTGVLFMRYWFKRRHTKNS